MKIEWRNNFSIWERITYSYKLIKSKCSDMKSLRDCGYNPFSNVKYFWVFFIIKK